MTHGLIVNVCGICSSRRDEMSVENGTPNNHRPIGTEYTRHQTHLPSLRDGKINKNPFSTNMSSLRDERRCLLVKVCGITRVSDAEVCASLGVGFCGFVFHPESPRFVTAEQAARIPTAGMKRVGVFTTHDVGEILEAMDVARLDYAQLHAKQSAACAEAVGAERVIRVCFEIPTQPYNAAFLLFDKPFDWRTLRRHNVPQPYFIAGGLNAENIREAVSCGAPVGVDLNSGVEVAPGEKDAARLRDVLRELTRKEK